MIASSLVAAMARALRHHGVPVALRSEVAFAEAIDAVGPARRVDLYWAGRATLIHRPEDVAAFDAAFAAVLEERTTWSAPSLPVPTEILVEGQGDGDGPGEDPDDRRVLRHSAVEQLGDTDLATCTADERAQLHRAISALRVGVATRRSRRRRPARRGDELDLRRTVQAALATDGEGLRPSGPDASCSSSTSAVRWSPTPAAWSASPTPPCRPGAPVVSRPSRSAPG
jgi:uncharacterized protein with von Willebrand factor type A (vWA) domain